MSGTALAIAGFEVRTKLRRLSTLVYFCVFAAVAALWMAAAGGAFASANIVFSSDKVFINAPYAIAQTVTVLGLLGMVTVAAFMGRSIEQDFETQTYPFFFTSPIAKRDYFFGRYLGAVALLAVILSGIAVGIVVGTHWPGVEASRVGPWSAGAIVGPYLTMLLPNVLFLGACFFGIAALARRMLPVYIAGVLVLMGYLVAARLLRDIDNRTVAALIDPIGSTALGVVTRYWSPAEKNTQLIPLAGELLWNRLLWLAVGLAVFAFCYARFRMAVGGAERISRRLLKRQRALEAATAAPPARTMPHTGITARRDLSTAAWLRQLPGLVRLYLRETVKNLYFAVIVLAGALFIFSNARVVGSVYGTNTYPVTYAVLDIASGTFALFMLVITAFYAGELTWRERDARMAPMADSMPVPGWLPFTAKLVTLFGVQALLQVVVLACGVLFQLTSGYTKLELGQYFYRLFVLQLPEYWMVAALALTVHAVVNHKYLGHFVVVLFYIVQVMLAGFGYDHRIYNFGSTPTVIYSDMNRYGDFLGPLRWFQLYWGAFAVLLLVVARLAWVRGTDSGWRARLQVARGRWGASHGAVVAVAGAVFVATGAWIYYNTDVLNIYRNTFDSDELGARYEKDYKSLLSLPQPKVVGVKIDVDLRPYEHQLRFRGTYTLRNKSEKPVTELLVNLPETAEVRVLEGSIAMKLTEWRPELGWRRFALARPLPAGEDMTFTFDLGYPRPGFSNSGGQITVLDNGTFVNSGLLPVLGYNERKELSEDRERRKHDLQPKDRMHDIDDVANRQRNYIAGDGDWIDFDATIATAPDQIALAPGYLQREWEEGGQRHFHYQMDVPILDFYAFLSARYTVRRDAWHGGGKDVPIEIYYQAGHEYDLDAMTQGVKDSLDYYTVNFSPYQHHQVRILEFPRYAAFAQSFPNTIPFSESIGFIAKVDPKDPKDIDYPYYVTAHEIAHQWWAHQVVGANVQGATMLSETLAQYSALMVMKRKFGDAKMKRFLKYELDSYLVGRGSERKREMPLYRNENQAYIHYRKGSLAMYELQDCIGEAAVNQALAAFIAKWAYQGPPYPTSKDLLAEFRLVTPEKFQYLIADLFETITLYENRAVSATWKKLPTGRYQVELVVEAKKLRADENGAQQEVPMNDWIDIGVLGKEDAPLFLEKRRIAAGRSTFTMEVGEQPLRAGIDPVVKLIDRRPDDNTVAVSEAGR